MGDGVNRPQPDLSLDQLLKQAEDSMPLFEQTANDVLEKLKAQNPELMEGVTFEMGPLKTRESINNKLPEVNGDYRQIKDMVRGRFVVDTPEQITAIKEALAETELLHMNDKYARPSNSTGYRDVNSKVGLENGHIGEIQLQQRNMLMVNKPTHEIMKEIVDIENLAQQDGRVLTPDELSKIDELKAQAVELHNAAAHDGNLNGLLENDVKEKFTYKGPVDADGSALGKVTETLGDLGKANKNVVVDVGIATTVAVGSLVAGSTPLAAAEAAGDTLNPIPETTEALRNNASGGEVAEAVTKDGSAWAGCFAGGYAGLKLGGTGGTFISPGLGTAIGGAGGAIGGCAVGAWAASGITESIINFFKGEEEEVSLDDVREILPKENTSDAPPEFAHLIEVQNSDALLQQALNDLQEDGSFPFMAEELAFQNNLLEQSEQPEANIENPQSEKLTTDSQYINTPSPA